MTESLHLNTQESTTEAVRLFSKIELDANFTTGYGMAAVCYVACKARRRVTDRAQEIAEAGRLARRAVELGADDAVAVSRAGHALAYVVENYELPCGAILRRLSKAKRTWPPIQAYALTP